MPQRNQAVTLSHLFIGVLIIMKVAVNIEIESIGFRHRFMRKDQMLTKNPQIQPLGNAIPALL